MEDAENVVVEAPLQQNEGAGAPQQQQNNGAGAQQQVNGGAEGQQQMQQLMMAMQQMMQHQATQAQRPIYTERGRTVRRFKGESAHELQSFIEELREHLEANQLPEDRRLLDLTANLGPRPRSELDLHPPPWMGST